MTFPTRSLRPGSRCTHPNAPSSPQLRTEQERHAGGGYQDSSEEFKVILKFPPEIILLLLFQGRERG